MAKSPVKASSKALAPTKERTSSPVSSNAFEADAGAGLEGVGASDLIIPRLAILQALSPQLVKKDAAYIAGAEVGMIADVGTGEIYPDGVLFLPVLYRKQWLQWAPRKSGKGLVAIHDDDSILNECEYNEKKQPILPNGDYIAETAQFFGLNLSAENRKCFIPMASTQLKKARKWLTLATSEKIEGANGKFTPPLYYRSYCLTSAEEGNSEGDWMGWVIDRDKSIPEMEDGREVYEIAKDFLATLREGSARADLSGASEVNAEAEEVL